MLQERFESILQDYLEDKRTYKNRPSPKTFTGLTSVTILTKELPEQFQRLSNLKDHYKFKGSVGQGNMAEIPHLCLFDTDITKSAQEGYYIVYLFDATMSKVYLSFNQGWTQYTRLYNVKKSRGEILSNAQKAQKILRSTETFSFEPIVLNFNRGLAVGYEKGNICSKVYEKGKVPEDAVLIDDLRSLVGVYKELKGIVEKSILDIFPRADEEGFQQKIQHAPSINLPDGPIPPKQKTPNAPRLVWSRNIRISAKALQEASYQCEYNNQHTTFISAKSGKQFVEAHHLIPLEFQEEFKYSLDVPENIIALCPNCHKAFHYGEVGIKRELVSHFLESRSGNLATRGIQIEKPKLFQFYQKSEDLL